eukprot:scaffold5297_cov55-Cyclotella_meneghiniana.AAC.1
MYALKQLYNSSSSNETVASSSDERIVEVPKDIAQARIEEKEVLEETAELEEERKRILETEKAAAAEARKEAQKHHQSSEAKFTSEAERRAYAKEVAAKAATGKPVSKDNDENKKTGASKYYAGSGVNDRDLCKDLFS